MPSSPSEFCGADVRALKMEPMPSSPSEFRGADTDVPADTGAFDAIVEHTYVAMLEEIRRTHAKAVQLICKNWEQMKRAYDSGGREKTFANMAMKLRKFVNDAVKNGTFQKEIYQELPWKAITRWGNRHARLKKKAARAYLRFEVARVAELQKAAALVDAGKSSPPKLHGAPEGSEVDSRPPSWPPGSPFYGVPWRQTPHWRPQPGVPCLQPSIPTTSKLHGVVCRQPFVPTTSKLHGVPCRHPPKADQKPIFIPAGGAKPLTACQIDQKKRHKKRNAQNHKKRLKDSKRARCAEEAAASQGAERDCEEEASEGKAYEEEGESDEEEPVLQLLRAALGEGEERWR